MDTSRSGWAGEQFPANIGPTSRWEFGYYFSRWEHRPQNYDLVLGSPEDAQSLKWPIRLARSRRLPWHFLERDRKDERVSSGFVEAIVQALLARKWCDCAPGATRAVARG
jgi:hypothetical protein